MSDNDKKPELVMVQLRDTGPVRYFYTGGLVIREGREVVIQSERGQEYGTVVGYTSKEEMGRKIESRYRVLRLAALRDKKRFQRNCELERSALVFCQERVRERKLEMKLIRCEYTFDRKRLTFFFTAENRVDFRELLKDLAHQLKTRIELRQIGVRDEAKSLGGCGVCGRAMCCNTFLYDFVPVTIRMVKDQKLPLNPGKISGVCGRLMCCIAYEHKAMMKGERGVSKEEGDHEVYAQEGKGGEKRQQQKPAGNRAPQDRPVRQNTSGQQHNKQQQSGQARPNISGQQQDRLARQNTPGQQNNKQRQDRLARPNVSGQQNNKQQQDRPVQQNTSGTQNNQEQQNKPSRYRGKRYGRRRK